MAGKSNVYHEVSVQSEALPNESVRVRDVVGNEVISQLFQFDIDIIVLDEPDLDPNDIVGNDIGLVFTLAPEGVEQRRMYGMIAAMECLFESGTEHRAYKLRMVPHAFRMTLIELQDIFLNTSIPEIIASKCKGVGLEIDMRLLESYPKQPFVVQYKETDLAFVSRLAEHHGISFFFEHTAQLDTMVFTDHPAGFVPIEGKDDIDFRPRGEQMDVYRFESRTKMIPAHYMQTEYNYETPSLAIDARHVAPTGDVGGVIGYGEHYRTPEEGLAIAKIRSQERESSRTVYSGQGDVCRMSAGGTFHLEGQGSVPKRLLITEIEHRASQSVVLEGGRSEGRTYTNVFKCIDASRTYRPPRRTPKPRIHGLVPGVIEPSGEIGKYAQIDEAGRYTVRFFFDVSPRGAVSSLPIRMMQPHAGPNYGMHFPLKPGIEVYVGFVEGDPDRPVIVGAVPNPITRSPVTRNNAIMNRIETTSGVFMEIRDI